ncbi:trypsin-like peptidase domain-containing protein [Nostoc sp. UHCC 0702]|nr:trypsin-like peptidase domain-containing protein [Nostoc sp. UHCC 0702]
MTKEPIYKQPLAVFFAAMLSVTTLGGWVSVQAQANREAPQSTPPKFTKFQDAGQLSIPQNGKPYKPSGLNQSEKPTAGVRGIPDGIDDRVPMLSREYPWSTIGRVQGTTADAKSYHCTGTLIAANIVLTNSHCVIDPDTHQLSKQILFLPNVINGNVQNKRDVALVEQVIYGTDFKGDRIANQVNDWAILKINKPLGRKYGYIGWKSIPSSDLIKSREKFFFVGYSGDFPDPSKKGYEFLSAGPGWTAGFQAGCSIVKEEKEILFHDCDTAGGSSGGPIIGLIDGEPYIIALNNAEIKDPKSRRDIVNLAVKISFLDQLAGRN